jgi:hypothetical protein
MATTHEKVMDGITIDVKSLVKAVKRRKAKPVEIDSLKGVSRSRKTGFSQKRYDEVNINKPILILPDGRVVDGRHRTLKSQDQGKSKIKAITVTKEDLKMHKVSHIIKASRTRLAKEVLKGRLSRIMPRIEGLARESVGAASHSTLATGADRYVKGLIAGGEEAARRTAAAAGGRSAPMLAGRHYRKIPTVQAELGAVKSMGRSAGQRGYVGEHKNIARAINKRQRALGQYRQNKPLRSERAYNRGLQQYEKYDRRLTGHVRSGRVEHRMGAEGMGYYLPKHTPTVKVSHIIRAAQSALDTTPAGT